jgi:hypothetical protein
LALVASGCGAGDEVAAGVAEAVSAIVRSLGLAAGGPFPLRSCGIGCAEQAAMTNSVGSGRSANRTIALSYSTARRTERRIDASDTLSDKIEHVMKRRATNKSALARAMKTSRTVVHRLLDPSDTGVTLATIWKGAIITSLVNLGRSIRPRSTRGVGSLAVR